MGLGGTHFPLHWLQERFYHEKVSLHLKVDIQVMKQKLLKIPQICIFCQKCIFFLPQKIEKTKTKQQHVFD